MYINRLEFSGLTHLHVRQPDLTFDLPERTVILAGGVDMTEPRGPGSGFRVLYGEVSLAASYILQRSQFARSETL